MNRLVIVGESNPYGHDPSMALYHLPRRASGDRLREHLGLTDTTYAALDKVNLCAGRWAWDEAKARAVEVAITRTGRDVVVLLGVKVRKAFAGPSVFAATQKRLDAYRYGPVLISLPHPSGLCRDWNHPDARAHARGVLAKHAPWVPWGEVP